MGVKKEVVKIIKNLNDSANIIVKTPFGTTEEFVIDSVVQQGSVSGGLLCVASLAEIINENVGIGFQIGQAIIKALAFVDDIATLSHDHTTARRQNADALKCAALSHPKVPVSTAVQLLRTSLVAHAAAARHAPPRPRRGK